MNVVDTITSSPIISAGGTVVVLATASILAYEWRRHREMLDDVEQWYGNAVGLVGQLQQTGHRATAYQQRADSDTIRSKLDPLADELQQHAGSAPNGVEREARVELIYLAAFASGLINLTEQSQDVPPSEFLQRVQDDAQERYDGEYTIKEMNELIDSLDVDALAEQITVDDDELEVNEEALDEFATHFSDESLDEGQPTSIQEALEMPLDVMDKAVETEAFWNEMVGDTMREYARFLLVDVSGDVYEAMERRKKRT